MSDKQKRLQEVYEHLRRWFGIHTQADFANSMKYSRNAISLALNGNEKYLTDKLFESICKAYPDTFNLDYLLTGNGELLTKKEPGVLFHAGGSASVSLDDEWQPTWQGSW